MRYPRGNALGVELKPLEKLTIGKGLVKRRGEKVAILNFGTLMPEAAKVAETLNATLVDMRFVKPLDESLILNLPRRMTCWSPWKKTPSWAVREAA